ncbi:MAG: colanic acid biosynthesis acetyltransferase WcaF [Cytophagales bacterium]|nr:MAG: colanic acid biosynthesis acetyltransferase WcaF [Cytophagales bacterium]
MQNLISYNNSWYNPGGNVLKRLLWYIINSCIFNSYFFPINFLKTFLLKLFGAKIGKGVVIKPAVNIKYPWFLEIGNYTWIGEKVWIDNLIFVKIGSNCCLSQGCMLLTGNHDFKKTTFDLIVKPITIENGVWLGAKSIVCPGVICHENSVLTVGSIATFDLEKNGIYAQNPLQKIKERVFE